MKVLFQRTKSLDFHIHYFLGVLAYFVVSRHFIWKSIIEDNAHGKYYRPNFIDSYFKSFLNKLYTSKVIVQSVPKRNVFVKLPFLGSILFQIQKKLQKL